MFFSFKKYNGCGNDFILFDNREGTFPLSKQLIQSLCHRQKGIGADGVLLLENSPLADFRFRIFNSDGSEAEMCGNGLRCFVKSLGYERTISLETMHSVLTATCTDNGVRIEMGSPRNIIWDIPLPFENKILKFQSIDTGVPHALLFTEQIDTIDLSKLGAFIRNSPYWGPHGTNVTLAELLASKPGKLKIRTYERGVEGETLACGTGAAAAALAAAHLFGLPSPIGVKTLSQEELWIGFSMEGQKFTHMTLEGPAKFAFSGEINLHCF